MSFKLYDTWCTILANVSSSLCRKPVWKTFSMLWKAAFQQWDPNRTTKRSKVLRFVTIVTFNDLKHFLRYINYYLWTLPPTVSRIYVSWCFLECVYYFQNHLVQLELEGNVRVNYTGSWLKTVNWLQWLTLLAARKYNGGKFLVVKRNVWICSFLRHLWFCSHSMDCFWILKARKIQKFLETELAWHMTRDFLLQP